MRMISVSVVSVPLSRAQPLTIIVSPVSPILYNDYTRDVYKNFRWVEGIGKNEEETTPDEYKLKAIILCRVIVNIDLVIPTTLY